MCQSAFRRILRPEETAIGSGGSFRLGLLTLVSGLLKALDTEKTDVHAK